MTQTQKKTLWKTGFGAIFVSVYNELYAVGVSVVHSFVVYSTVVLALCLTFKCLKLGFEVLMHQSI